MSTQRSLLASALVVLFGLLSPLGYAQGQATKEATSELARSQLKAAREAYRHLLEAEKKGTRSFDAERHYAWSKRILEAERLVARGKKEELTAVEAHAKRMSAIEQKAKQLARAGMAGADEVAAAAFYVAEAALWKDRAKAKK